LILVRSGHFRCDLRNFEFLFIRGAGKQALKVQRRRNPLEHSRADTKRLFSPKDARRI
jgi:hypothetical protein